MKQGNTGHSEEAHGHEKAYTIVVNGRQRTVKKHKLTYLEIVQIAFPNEQPSDTAAFTVTYSNRHGKEGSLVDGQTTEVHEGMVFNVRKTDRS